MVTLTLDRPVTQEWVSALHQMGSYASVFGIPPQSFRFRDSEANVRAGAHDVQAVIDHFKQWLPNASRRLKYELEQEVQRKEAERRERLRRQRIAEDERLRVLQNVRI